MSFPFSTPSRTHPPLTGMRCTFMIMIDFWVTTTSSIHCILTWSMKSGQGMICIFNLCVVHYFTNTKRVWRAKRRRPLLSPLRTSMRSELCSWATLRPSPKRMCRGSARPSRSCSLTFCPWPWIAIPPRSFAMTSKRRETYCQKPHSCQTGYYKRWRPKS